MRKSPTDPMLIFLGGNRPLLSSVQSCFMSDLHICLVKYAFEQKVSTQITRTPRTVPTYVVPQFLFLLTVVVFG